MDAAQRQRLLELLQQQEGGGGAAPEPVRYHPGKSLHKPLFDPANWARWVDPALLEAIKTWRTRKESGVSNDFSAMDLDALLGLKVEAPGIISFPAFNDEFCQILLEEVRHYREQGMPSRAPNSMNNYGLVLNEIGLRPIFSALLREVFLPVGARLFGDESDRVRAVRGTPVGTENWGGSTLDDHHTFIVQYRPSDDKHLDMHIDECDVTFNFGITPHENFEGNDLTFCGMFDSDGHRKYHHTYKHVKGRCVVHSGKRRHGALDIEKGERASLIMWTKSQSFRRTPEYQRRNRGGLNRGPADRVCLSYTHDPDYKVLTPKKLQYHMKPREDGDADALSNSSASTQVPKEKRWVRVCANSDLGEGKTKMISFEKENEQVAVFRHRGKLHALDNRCAHMGGPLCQGDIEDLGAHWRRGDAQKLAGSDQRKEDGVVKCPRHGMCFNLRTGENIKGGHMRQKVFPVRLTSDGRDIEIEAELEVQQEAPRTSDPEETTVLDDVGTSPAADASAAIVDQLAPASAVGGGAEEPGDKKNKEETRVMTAAKEEEEAPGGLQADRGATKAAETPSRPEGASETEGIGRGLKRATAA